MKHPIHEIALAIPEISEHDLGQMVKSIQDHGQRDPAVLLDGKLLDGRSRQMACEKLGIALIVRHYDPERDGPSPAQFVADVNINRRHLSASQRAMAAQALLPHFEAEAAARKASGKKADESKKAAEAAGAAVGVSPRTVEAAKAVADADPALAADVTAGKTTVHAAAKKVAKKKAAEPVDDPELDQKRKEFRDAVASELGDEFADAFAKGTVLKTREDVESFVVLDPADMKAIKSLVVEGWSVKKALAFHRAEVGRGDEISSLFRRTLMTGKKSATFRVDGWTIKVTRDEKTAD